MKTGICALALAMAAVAPAQAALTSLDLANYRLSATYQLPSVTASEASAITWSWDTDTLFVIGDEGDYVVEVDKQGNQLSKMNLFGFDDTEGLTYVGNNQFVVVEERLQSVYLFDYTADGAIGRSFLQSATLGPTVGNVGLEGISYDPASGGFILVKEKVPQAVYGATVNFATGSASVSELVARENQFSQLFGTLDLSEVQVLSTVPSLLGSADQDNLLILSQETPRLMEVTRDGTVLGSFDLSAVAPDIEGLTIDGNGTIYLTGETPLLYVLTPVPEPASYAMLLAGLALFGGIARRRLR
ncbi:MAG: PEP-CTERM sorting domain-containing protein [Dechloromonas sp.]|nr:MAG: PEP-CTERM sorting domain-containing protein [Dechloromonas sp.]